MSSHFLLLLDQVVVSTLPRDSSALPTSFVNGDVGDFSPGNIAVYIDCSICFKIPVAFTPFFVTSINFYFNLSCHRHPTLHCLISSCSIWMLLIFAVCLMQIFNTRQVQGSVAKFRAMVSRRHRTHGLLLTTLYYILIHIEDK